MDLWATFQFFCIQNDDVTFDLRSFRCCSLANKYLDSETNNSSLNMNCENLMVS